MSSSDESFRGHNIIHAARRETLQRLMEFLASSCGSAGAQSMQERLAPV
ncbi:hypothetical protein ABIB38_003673 [Massilia sp. UYP11]